MSGYFNCPQCGANIENNSDSPTVICDYCRSEVENPFYMDAQYADPNITDGEPVRRCRSCGRILPKDANKCVYCGNTVPNFERDAIAKIFNYTSNTGRPKNKWVAIFYCLFFGWIGAHKFYEERYIAGIFYACTFGFFYIGVIIDLINLFSKTETYYI